MNLGQFRVRRTCPQSRESGQTMGLVLMVLGLFLLGAAGFATDIANLWFHRQLAQDAADAACTAGAMDLLSDPSGVAYGNWGTVSTGTALSCSSTPNATPCRYANLNGYNGTGLVSGTPSNDVQFSFPAAASNPAPGVTAPPTSVAPIPFLRVDVVDRTKVIFAGMMMGSRTADVRASAVCGVGLASSPIPIIVLNPSCPHAFEVSGSATAKIVGGPSRSIQVNSNNSCAAATQNSGCSGNGTIDLSKGGPSFTGSDFGVFGGPGTAPSRFTGAAWGPGSRVNDPYAQVSAPALPALSPTNGINPNNTTVAYNVDGCPDHAGCIEYKPGRYTSPIVVKNITAIFVPGIYYLQGTKNDNCGTPGTGCVASPTGQCRYGLDVDSNGVVRPAASNAPGNDGSGGTVFYLSGTGVGNYASVFFGSNAGNPGGRTIDSFQTSVATCAGGTAPPTQLNLPATVDGNVLLGQCTSKGTYLGSASTDTSGTVRGLLFFQDRANADTNGQASMQGGGGLVLSGSLYFHHCNASGTGTGCLQPPSGFKAFFQLQGNPGGSTYVLGNITADELILSGNGNVSMALNPDAVYNILKASLYR